MRLLSAVATIFALFSVLSDGMAFPPLPYYTLFGTVRDQAGQTVVADNAEVLLAKNGTVLQRTPIASVVGGERNYELNIELDASRPGTAAYSEKSIAPNGEFGLIVELNGQRFYPIEVAGTLRAGRGSELVRLDLTLGVDSDRDGLPDVWEEWQLYQAGYFPDDNGKWDISLITANGDFDGDGQSNLKEYYAGTFAGDATETFDLEIKGLDASKALVEFYGITNKFYWIEQSTDLKTWAPANFAVGTAPVSASHVAPAAGIVNASIPRAPGGTKTFYRLNVR
jgi:hypothetical protein